MPLNTTQTNKTNKQMLSSHQPESSEICHMLIKPLRTLKNMAMVKVPSKKVRKEKFGNAALFSSLCVYHYHTHVILLCIKRNQTFDVEEEDDDDYNNYDITEICSDDSTDDETNPKRPPPSWAEGVCLSVVVSNLQS